jgi:hypothetical protein
MVEPQAYQSALLNPSHNLMAIGTEGDYAITTMAERTLVVCYRVKAAHEVVEAVLVEVWLSWNKFASPSTLPEASLVLLPDKILAFKSITRHVRIGRILINFLN